MNEMRRLINLIESAQTDEGIFDFFKSKPKEPEKPEIQLSPEEEKAKAEQEQAEFDKKQKIWHRSMLNAYNKLPELIALNQWSQIKGKATLIKNNFAKGIKAGYIEFPTPEKEKTAINSLNRALNMKVFDEIKVDTQNFAGGGTGALLGLALGGPIGMAVGGAMGSKRKAGKMSQQELAILNARQKTDQKRYDNKDAVINRLDKFKSRFEKLISIS